MNLKPHTTQLIMAFVALVVWCSCSAENIVTADMAGHWEGNARIIVSWCQQTNLFVSVNIDAGGGVSGKIGDATLVAGHFLPHRTWPWRHTIVTGKLDGAIVAAENITRSHVTMICDFSNDSFKGQIDTDGSLCVFSSKNVRRERMALTAVDLQLKRSQSSP